MQYILSQILNKNIWKIILAIFCVEILSLISFQIAILSAIFFILILIVVSAFTVYQLKYGLYIALIELMIGSYGYLFYLQLPGFKMPLRLGIFLVVFFIWLLKYFKPGEFFAMAKNSRLIQTFLAFLFFIVLGVVNGILHNNGLKNVFFDFNGYLYFGLFFIFLQVFKNQKQIADFLQLFLASLIYVSLKIFLTLYIFTHGFTKLAEFLYTWIRDTRVGEITWAGGSFFRIFLQSQIYSLVAIFIILSLIIYLFSQKEKLSETRKTLYSLLTILIIIQTSILISFSRSYWLGGIIGMLALFAYIILIYWAKFKTVIKLAGIACLAGLFSIFLMLDIVTFPIPQPGLFTADLLKDRFTTDDAAASSRWNLLPILLNKNKEHLILGSGFGTTVTYQTNDPRIKNEQNPDGWYTTDTFEWGYLDTVTEIGVIGLLVYLALIAQIFWQGIKTLKTPYSLLTAGFLIGLIALLVTHGFSPYLNHPLGIGYLMLCAGIFQVGKPED